MKSIALWSDDVDGVALLERCGPVGGDVEGHGRLE